MGILQKLKKLGSLHFVSPRNDRQQIHDERNLHYGPLPRSFLSAVDLARQEAGYDSLPVHHRRRPPPPPIHGGDMHLMDRNPRPEFGAFDQNRQGSHERRFDRRGSPEHFKHHPLPGTPIKYRRRPISPDLLQPRVSSPFAFGQHSAPASPEMFHHFQHVQQQQQQQQQQPHQQFDMVRHPPAPPVQFYPQFQSPLHPMMYPNANIPPWFMMTAQQQQQQMYPFY